MSTLENLPQETPPEPAMSPLSKLLLFGGGFLGWYAVTGVGWLNFIGGDLSYGWWRTYGIPNLCLLPGTLIALLVFGLNRKLRMIALGILAALALNFLVSLILGLSENAICFVPFFIK